ncbi:MAG TPA: PLD nuclease N-terminal domain-containing protein [Streptosporangiaceae bacterium]|jgi:hypothetical protein
MLLPVVLFALLTVGFWVPCMLDVVTTPRYHFRGLSKGTWLLLVAALWVFGAIIWLLAGRPGARLQLTRRPQSWPAGRGPAEALRRHPAARSSEGGYSGATPDWEQDGPARRRPLGPDDDPDFLLALDRQIRRERDDW